MNRSKMIFSAFILLLGIPWLAEGYDVESTHQIINTKAAESSNCDQYLKDYLGFYKGLDQSFAGKAVWRWLEEGGKEEDLDWRFPNHFHNPLKAWNEAEFDNVWCDIFYATSTQEAPSLRYSGHNKGRMHGSWKIGHGARQGNISTKL